jgi:hypothetical protein
MMFDIKWPWPWVWALWVLENTGCGDGGEITRGETLELGKEVA